MVGPAVEQEVGDVDQGLADGVSDVLEGDELEQGGDDPSVHIRIDEVGPGEGGGLLKIMEPKLEGDMSAIVGQGRVCENSLLDHNGSSDERGRRWRRSACWR